MELSPEERRRIYEEEKARIEAREQLERERWGASRETTTGLPPNVAGLLCYLFGWVTGLIFFIVEQRNRWVRFHAAQSIIVFVTLTVASALLGWIPIIGAVFSTIIGILGFVLWIVLMVRAHNGERYHLPWAGYLAERMVASAGEENRPSPPEPPSPPRPEAAGPETPPPPPGPPPPPWGPGFGPRWEERAARWEDRAEWWGDRTERRAERFFRRRREGRITASAFAIAWSIILLVFFNFFNGYVALYSQQVVGGVTEWVRQPFFTSDIGLWLPILNATLIISIIGHIFLMVFDRRFLWELLHIVFDVFVVATVMSLLAIFPFDFSVIPSAAVANGVSVAVIVVLVCVAVGGGIGIIVRIIRLIASLVRGLIG